MKKNLTIIALLLIVSVAFFSCSDREFSGLPVALDPIVFDASEIAAAMSSIAYWGAPSADVAVTANKVRFNLSSGTDQYGVRITLPPVAAMYHNIEVTFKLDSLTTGRAKIGFKAGHEMDLTPYDDFELYWGLTPSVGTSFTQRVPMAMLPGGALYFNHNQWEDGDATKPPIDYTLEITAIKINP